MAKQVTYCRFHQSVQIPSVGEIGNSLPNQSKTFRSLSMAEGPNGIILNINSVSAVIPYANVIVYATGEELPAPPKAAKSS